MGQTAQAGQDFQNTQATQAGQQLGGYLGSLQAKGAPGGGQAQAQLASIVAAQQDRAQADARASQALAASQSASQQGLAAGLAGTAQLQGTQTKASIRQAIASGIAQQNLKYGQDFREALGKKADAQALKGATLTTKLGELRGQEQQFIEAMAAIHQRSQAAKLSAATTRRGQNISAKTSRRGQNLTYKAALGNIHERVRHDQITEAQARKAENRLNKQRRQGIRQFNLTHILKGKHKGESKGTKGTSSGSSGDDTQRAIQHMIAKLNTANPKRIRKLSRQEVIANLVGLSTTYTRQEAAAAYKRWHKHQRRKKPSSGGNVGGPGAV